MIVIFQCETLAAFYHMITQARLPSVTLGSALTTPPLAVVPF